MGVRITTSMLYRTALADVARTRAQLANSQEQASSGLRVNRPSDDPVQAHAAMVLRDALAATAQFERNATQAQGRVRATEDALADSIDALTRARELAVSGSNGTLDAVSRGAIAAEVEGLHRRLLANANDSFQGAHLFAGHTADQAPFSATGPFVGGSPAPGVVWSGDSNEVQIEVDDGVRLPVSLDGRRVFQGDGNGDGSPDAGSENLFSVLGDLRDALQANDPAAVSATLDRLDRGLTQLNVERTRIGAVDSELDTQQRALSNRTVGLTTRLSEAQDADVAAVFSSLARQEAALQASLQATARLLSPTLLDYLR